MKFINKSDIDNMSMEKLPIRRGCYGGPCACLGTCQQILGWVDRKEYDDFIKSQITLNDFLTSKCENDGKE